MAEGLEENDGKVLKSGLDSGLTQSKIDDIINIPKGSRPDSSSYLSQELNLLDFEFWYFMTNEQVSTRINGLMKRYPNRKLVPFARRDDSDDIACFEVGKEPKVQIIHDFASEGYEQRGEYEGFWDWMKMAVDELIEKGGNEDCIQD